MAGRKLAVDVQIVHPAWRKAWRGGGVDIRRLLAAAGSKPELGGRALGHVAVLLADDLTLRGLNARFRGQDRPTNVLSFPDRALPLGGIALAFETVQREAQAQRKEFINHSKHMILHGFLHLLEYDHETAKGARLMEGLETAILSGMGIPDPYVIRTKPRA